VLLLGLLGLPLNDSIIMAAAETIPATHGLFVNPAKREIEEYIPFGSTYVPDGVKFIHHPGLSRTHTEWPKSTDQSCLHCEEPFEGTPLPIPRSYNLVTGKLEADPGVVCCVPCLRGYLIEHLHFDMPLRWAIAQRMLKDVFNLKGPFGVAPPRSALKKHGGPYTAQDFRECTEKIVVQQSSPFLCLLRPTVYKETPVVVSEAVDVPVPSATDPAPPIPEFPQLTIEPPPPQQPQQLPLPLPPPPPPFLPPKPPRKRRPTKKEKAPPTDTSVSNILEDGGQLLPPPPPPPPVPPKTIAPAPAPPKLTPLQRLLFSKKT